MRLWSILLSLLCCPAVSDAARLQLLITLSVIRAVVVDVVRARERRGGALRVRRADGHGRAIAVERGADDARAIVARSDAPDRDVLRQIGRAHV